MKKKEFMDELRAALDGNVPTQVYYDTVNYYESYFKKQREAGKTEDEICKELGSARLIAKTIIDTNGRGASGQYYDAGSARDSSSSERQSRKTTKKGWHVNVDDYGNTSLAYGKLDFSTTVGKIIFAIAAVLVLALVIGIFIGIVWLGIKIVWYVVIPVAVVLFVVNLIIYLIGGGSGGGTN